MNKGKFRPDARALISSHCTPATQRSEPGDWHSDLGLVRLGRHRIEI